MPSYYIPFVNLYHEAAATDKALGYVKQYESVADQKETHRLLGAAYGSYVGGNIAYVASPALAWSLGGIAGGHIVGNIAGAIESKDRRQAAAPPPSLDTNEPNLPAQ